MRKKRVNKVLGVILAIVLPLTIFGLMAMAFMLPSQEVNFNIFDSSSYAFNKSNNEKWEETFTDITQLEVNGVIDSITIKESADDTTKVSYVGSTRLSRSTNGNFLSIKSKDNNRGFYWGHRDKTGTGTLTIELSKKVKYINLDSGVGVTTIDGLNLDSLDIDGGVGFTNLTNLDIKNSLDIDAGVGEVNIRKVSAAEVDINGGVGEITIQELTANYVKLDIGIGSVSIDSSTIDTLKTQKGIGSYSITNSEVKNEDRIHNDF